MPNLELDSVPGQDPGDVSAAGYQLFGQPEEVPVGGVWELIGLFGLVGSLEDLRQEFWGGRGQSSRCGSGSFCLAYSWSRERRFSFRRA